MSEQMNKNVNANLASQQSPQINCTSLKKVLKHAMWDGWCDYGVTNAYYF